MKTVISLAGGAFVVGEQAGDFYVMLDGSIGGGSMAGIIEGQAKIKLGSGSVGLKAGEAFVNHLLPDSMQAFALAAEEFLNVAVAKL